MKNLRKLKPTELQQLSREEVIKHPKQPLIIILENIRSAFNVGSIFRTADAFGVQAIYLCGITARPPHREILKTALGATETVQWFYFETIREAIQEAEKNGFTLAAVEQTNQSIPLNRFKAADKTALILGNEIDGVSREALQGCQVAIDIPQQGMKHSLNVAVCAGIVLWELTR